MPTTEIEERSAPTPPDSAGAPAFLGQPACSDQGAEGTSRGVNIEPGSNDDGWVVPLAVELGDGTRLQLYKDGEALHAAFGAIERAKRRVCLEVYIFGGDETGRAFAGLLSKRAREGLRVYVLYDSFGSVGTDRALFESMRTAGVSVREFHPLRPWELHSSWRPFNRDHRKLLLIDDDIAGMGGLNVAGEYAGSWVVRSREGDCRAWRDNAIGIVGPGAKPYLQCFAAAWNYAARGGRVARTQFLQNLEDESAELGVLGSAPTVNSPLVGFLRRQIASARKSIELTMAYFAPPDGLAEALCAAARRGVRVRLMLPGKCDVRLLEIAARSFYARFISAGIEVYERQHAVLHAKTMLIDGRTTIIGSTNLDYRSIEYNLELSAVVRSERFGANVHDLFENDVRFARRITAGEWRRRPWQDVVGQWAVSRARYLL